MQPLVKSTLCHALPQPYEDWGHRLATFPSEGTQPTRTRTRPSFLTVYSAKGSARAFLALPLLAALAGCGSVEAQRQWRPDRIWHDTANGVVCYVLENYRGPALSCVALPAKAVAK